MLLTLRRYRPDVRTISFTLNRGVKIPDERPCDKLCATKGSQATGTSAKYKRTGRATSTFPPMILISSVSKW